MTKVQKFFWNKRKRLPENLVCTKNIVKTSYKTRFLTFFFFQQGYFFIITITANMTSIERFFQICG